MAAAACACAGVLWAGSEAAEAPLDWSMTRFVGSSARGASHFGSSVAIDGSTIAVGSEHDDVAGRDSGSVTVIRDRSGLGWWANASVVRIVAPGVTAGSRFGHAVALDGPNMVVGAPGAGRAYLICDTAASGEFRGRLVVRLETPEGERVEGFGQAVAVSGSTAVVGAIEDGRRWPRTGSVWVFRDTSRRGVWRRNSALRVVPADVSPGDRFGSAVAINGRTMLVGAPFREAAGKASGAAYILRDTSPNGTWRMVTETLLLPEDGSAYATFGRAVALSERTAVVASAGAVYIFRDISDAGDWSRVGQTRLGLPDTEEPPGFGSAIGLGSGMLAVGAVGSAAGSPTGAVYVFHDPGPGGGWSTGVLGRIPGPRTWGHSWFGRAVAVSGQTLVVAAPGEDDPARPDIGAVYIYGSVLFADGFESRDSSGWVSDGVPPEGAAPLAAGEPQLED
jgi:hypothetical protein